MKKATVSKTNGRIRFNVDLLEDGADPDLSSYWVSVDDGGTYLPYMVQEQRGKLNLYNVDGVLHPSTWRELLRLVSEDTPKSREAVSAEARQ